VAPGHNCKSLRRVWSLQSRSPPLPVFWRAAAVIATVAAQYSRVRRNDIVSASGQIEATVAAVSAAVASSSYGPVRSCPMPQNIKSRSSSISSSKPVKYLEQRSGPVLSYAAKYQEQNTHRCHRRSSLLSYHHHPSSSFLSPVDC
jgi:hypothetical protein